MVSDRKVFLKNELVQVPATKYELLKILVYQLYY